MIKKFIIFGVIFIQVARSQLLLSPINYPPGINELLIKCSQTIPNLSPAESDIICKNFANSIQNIVLEKFAQNCLRKPVFGQIAGPLINEVATNVCKCPVCSAVNLTPTSYSKTYVTPATVSNIINNANGFVNNGPNNLPLFNSLPVNVVNNVPGNNVPINFVIASNSVRPANNVQVTDLMSLLKGLTECPCKNPVIV